MGFFQKSFAKPASRSCKRVLSSNLKAKKAKNIWTKFCWAMRRKSTPKSQKSRPTIQHQIITRPTMKTTCFSPSMTMKTTTAVPAFWTKSSRRKGVNDWATLSARFVISRSVTSKRSTRTWSFTKRAKFPAADTNVATSWRKRGFNRKCRHSRWKKKIRLRRMKSKLLTTHYHLTDLQLTTSHHPARIHPISAWWCWTLSTTATTTATQNRPWRNFGWGNRNFHRGRRRQRLWHQRRNRHRRRQHRQDREVEDGREKISKRLSNNRNRKCKWRNRRRSRISVKSTSAVC